MVVLEGWAFSYERVPPVAAVMPQVERLILHLGGGANRIMQPLVRSHEERRCSVLGPAQRRTSPSIL